MRTDILIGTVCNGAGPILVDSTEWPKIGLLNTGFENMLLTFARKDSKGPRKRS